MPVSLAVKQDERQSSALDLDTDIRNNKISALVEKKGEFDVGAGPVILAVKSAGLVAAYRGPFEGK